VRKSLSAPGFPPPAPTSRPGRALNPNHRFPTLFPQLRSLLRLPNIRILSPVSPLLPHRSRSTTPKLYPACDLPLSPRLCLATIGSRSRSRWLVTHHHYVSPIFGPICMHALSDPHRDSWLRSCPLLLSPSIIASIADLRPFALLPASCRYHPRQRRWLAQSHRQSRFASLNSAWTARDASQPSVH
jgi:hypothetical protein